MVCRQRQGRSLGRRVGRTNERRATTAPRAGRRPAVLGQEGGAVCEKYSLDQRVIEDEASFVSSSPVIRFYSAAVPLIDGDDDGNGGRRTGGSGDWIEADGFS